MKWTLNVVACFLTPFFCFAPAQPVAEGVCPQSGAASHGGKPQDIQNAPERVIAVDGVRNVTLADALSHCPAGAAGCHVVVPGNLALMSGVIWSNMGSPLLIECDGGSDQNLGGSTITFLPQSAPATAFLIQNGSRFILKNCTLLQSSVDILQVTGSGRNAVYQTASPHGFRAGSTFVSIQNANPLSRQVLANNTTALVLATPSPTTFAMDNAKAVACVQNCGFANISGPVAALTRIVGDGSVASGNCLAACNFVAGQSITITGNSNGSFNTTAIVLGVQAGTAFTFVSTTKGAGSGGIAQQGVNGVVLQGAQGSAIQDSIITHFSGDGWRVGDAENASGIYNECRNSRIFNNQINWEINQLFPTKASNQNVEFNCELVLGNLFSVRGTGTTSEVSFFSGDVSGNTSPLVQAGDNVNSARNWNFYNVSMENTVPVNNQVGIQNNAQFSDIHVEGGLANGTGNVTVSDGTIPGACHILKVGSAFTVQGMSWTSTCPPFKFDVNGNVGLGGADPIPGTPPSINAPSGWTLCGAGSCPFVVTSSGIVGNGAQAHMGSVANPWLDMTVGRLQAKGVMPACFFLRGGGPASSCLLEAGSTDMAGTIIATTGAGETQASGAIQLNFSSPYGSNSPSCSYTLNNAGGGNWDARATVMDKVASKVSDLFTWDNNGVKLRPSTAFKVNYWCAAK